MKMCEYGAGCNRPGCIYRHDDNGGENSKKSDGVCVLFLAGKCSYKAKGCRKRHPPPEEVKRLKAKYQKIKCRHGDECFTDGCLYLHPRDLKDQDDPVAFIDPRDFPTLMGNGPSSTAAAPVIKPVPNSAWNSAPVGIQNGTGTNEKNGTSAPHMQRQQHAKSPAGDQKEVPGPPPPTPVSPPSNQEQVHMEMPPPQQQVWGSGAYPAPMMMPPMPVFPQQQQQEYYGNMMVDPNTGYPIDPAYFHQAMMYHQQQFGGVQYGIPVPMEATHFNAEAKEFIPGSSG